MTAKIKTLGRYGSSHYKNKPRGVSDRAFEKVYWPYLPVVILAGALLSFGAFSGNIQAAMRASHKSVLAYATSMTLSNLLNDTNSARIQNGVSPLNLNSQLNAAAQASANDMAARNYWSHNTPEGNPPWVWVSDQGYSYQKLGQNLAAGFTDEQSTIDGWMASPPHRANMLDPDYVDVGFGSANNPDYTSAGGGPMTIVVAFYGDPTPAAVAAAPTPAAPTYSAPAAPAPTSSQVSPPTSSVAASSPPASASAAAKTPVSSPAKKTSSSKLAPETTQTPTTGVTLAYRTTKAQIAFAHLPQATLANTFALVALFAAAGLWLSRHLLALRRAVVRGEAFVITHPLIDVGLLTVAAMSFLLTQTAGFIQ
jgi:hypothetical protein